MKNLFFIALLIFTGSVTLEAQLYEKSVNLSVGNRDALTITIPNTSVKDAEKVWQAYMDDYYNSKPKMESENKRMDH